MRQFSSSAWAVAALTIISLAPLATSPAKAASTGCLPGTLNQRLNQIRAKFGTVRIISTHRRGATIAGTGRPSYHASCRAVDFRAPRGKHAQVVAWLKKNHKGGVGTYSCGMHHIHIDNGPHVRFHHCVNTSGRPTKTYARSKNSGKRQSRVARRSSPQRRVAGVTVRRPSKSQKENFSAINHFAGSKINGG